MVPEADAGEEILEELEEQVTERQRATSIEHLLTHLPKNKYCSACQRGKMIDTQKRAKTGTDLGPSPARYGQEITCDHLVARSAAAQGVEGERNMLVVRDRATGMVDCFPVQSKSSQEVSISLRCFLGQTKPGMIYTDCAPELAKAIENIAAHGTAQPYRHETNGRIERTIRLVAEGARTCLAQSGLPSRFWPLACRHFCFSYNQREKDGVSPWFRKHKAHLKGKQYPFGSLVYYYPPEPDRKEMPKFEPRAKAGLMMGYHLQPGEHFRGEYLVMDFEEIKNTPNARYHDCRYLKPIRVQRTTADPDVDEVVFPMRKLQEAAMFDLPEPELMDILQLGADPLDVEAVDLDDFWKAIERGELPSDGLEPDEIEEIFRLPDTSPAGAAEESHEEPATVDGEPLLLDVPTVHETGGAASSSGLEPHPMAIHMVPADEPSEEPELADPTAANNPREPPMIPVTDADFFVGCNDYWDFDDERCRLIRVHRDPRVTLFTPDLALECPVKTGRLSIMRYTDAKLETCNAVVYDQWRGEGMNHRALHERWTGTTTFYVAQPGVAVENDSSLPTPRLGWSTESGTKIDNRNKTNRPVWVTSQRWTDMGNNPKAKATMTALNAEIEARGREESTGIRAKLASLNAKMGRSVLASGSATACMPLVHPADAACLNIATKHNHSQAPTRRLCPSRQKSDEERNCCHSRRSESIAKGVESTARRTLLE
jgi:hypothetical protein